MKLCFRMVGASVLTTTLMIAGSLVAGSLGAGSLGAGSTRFVSTWKNPNAAVIDVSGEKVAVFVVSADDSMRLGPEETLAAEMRRRGVDCIAGHIVLPGELAKDLEKARKFLQRAKITAAIMIRVVDERQKARYSLGMAWYAAPYYPSFWGYWHHGWAAAYTPVYAGSDTVLSVETLVYSVDEDTLLWAGMSETTNPKEIRKFVKDLVKAAGKQMRKAGLVKE